MSDPRDDIEAWLHEEVEPLRPPPGTFEQIRKRARRRKARRAVLSAASAGGVAVVIVLAVVALPRAVPSVLHLKPNPAGNNDSAATVPATSAPAATSRGTASAAPASDAPAASSPEGFGYQPGVPAHFAATSVTFIGLNTGWVIGQAGIPGHCATRYCTSAARTDDAGQSWYGVPAPGTGPPDGGTGVSQNPVPERAGRVGVRPGAVGHPRRRPALGAGPARRAAGAAPGDGRPRGVRRARAVHRDGG